jgi:nucleotide-binding universal stress UspA family protein
MDFADIGDDRLVRPKEAYMTNPTSRVIVGVDECPAGLRALRYAVAEARRRGATLVAARIWSVLVPWPPTALEQITHDEMSEQAVQTVHRAFLAALAGPPRDVSVQIRSIHGAPGPELVRLADREDDLLVVGSRQRTALGRAVHGSTARYCVTHATCPVLVVPHELAKAGTERALSRRVQREVQRLVDAS